MNLITMNVYYCLFFFGWGVYHLFNVIPISSFLNRWHFFAYVHSLMLILRASLFLGSAESRKKQAKSRRSIFKSSPCTAPRSCSGKTRRKEKSRKGKNNEWRWPRQNQKMGGEFITPPSYIYSLLISL